MPAGSSTCSSSVPGGKVGFLIFTMLFIFFIAFFLDFFEICFIVIPMLLPAAKALDINLIWFGLLVCVNMQTSFMHPPFGFALFYLRGIAPREVKSSDIYWGSIPWIGLQLALVAILIAFPQSVTYWIGTHETLDPAAVERALEGLSVPDPTGGIGMPDFGTPPDLNLEPAK